MQNRVRNRRSPMAPPDGDIGLGLRRPARSSKLPCPQGLAGVSVDRPPAGRRTGVRKGPARPVSGKNPEPAGFRRLSAPAKRGVLFAEVASEGCPAFVVADEDGGQDHRFADACDGHGQDDRGDFRRQVDERQDALSRPQGPYRKANMQTVRKNLARSLRRAVHGKRKIDRYVQRRRKHQPTWI